MKLKRKVIEKELNKMGIAFDDMPYEELRKFHAEALENAQVLFKPIQEEIEEEIKEKYNLEKELNDINDEEKRLKEVYEKYLDFRGEDVKHIDKGRLLSIEREVLTHLIIDLMAKLKGKINGTREEIDYMFILYNKYYKRSDSPGCSSCVARVYDALKKIN